MKNIPEDAELLVENSHSLLYRWQDPQRSDLVIIKILNSDNPKNIHLIQLINEFEITNHLNLPFVRKALERTKINNKEAVILDYVSGYNLKEWVKSRGALDVWSFLKMSIKLSSMLEEIHKKGYYHRDINSSNIIIDATLEQISLIDFGLATQFDSQTDQYAPEGLEGTLGYISPEQTGRMNRKIDYRTDLYSLGVTFYEMITGRLPFDFEDTLEMVHAHLAIEPKSVNEWDEKIPFMISSIIKKLLSKNAEMRYQSAAGLQADLEKCLFLLEKEGHISAFPLGEHDFSSRFSIPQKLYGRDKEISQLRELFEKTIVSNKQELLLLKGGAGVGKSALAGQIQKSIAQHNGYYIFGKYDELQFNIPYSAIIQAFKGLVDILLSETKEEIENWRKKLLKAVGDSGNVLIEVIPNLELIIGSQPKLGKVGAVESSYRFAYVFTNFIKAVVGSKRPLVIFLDDLQWADVASLDLIRTIRANKEIDLLFIIGAFRDDEINTGHPLLKTIEEVAEGRQIHQWQLAPLKEEVIVEIITETLVCTAEKAEPLAKIIYSKTFGNAFFVNQFFKSLYDQEYLKWEMQPDGLQGAWVWNEGDILGMNITDNVVELLTSSIRKMESATQDILKAASCIGNRFSLPILSKALHKTDQEIFLLIQPALRDGLVVPYGKSRSASPVDSDTWQLEFSKLKFTHDRIQQAAYALLGNEEKKQFHFRIGETLIAYNNSRQSDEYVFEVVNHFKLAGNLVSEPQSKMELARFNFLAGKRAKRSVAFAQAMDYFNHAIALLAETKPWLSNYALSLELYTEAAETAYLVSNKDLMDHYIQEILDNASELLEKVRAYEIKIQYHQSQNQLLEAVHTALGVLALLGVKLPSKPTKLHIILGLIGVQTKLTQKKVETLHELPLMTDHHAQAAMRILVNINSSSYYALPDLFPLVVFKQVQMSLKYGNSEFSAFSYASFGVVKTGVLGDIQGGYQLGKAAGKILGQFSSKGLQVRTAVVMNGFLNHWIKRPQEFVRDIPSLYQQAQEAGDIEYVALLAFNQTLFSYYLGQSLNRLEQEVALRDEIIGSYNQVTPLYFNKIYWQTILNLRGKSFDRLELKGLGYDDEAMRPIHEQAKDGSSLFVAYSQKAYLCFMFGAYKLAEQHSTTAKKYLENVIASMPYPMYFFYDTLIRLSFIEANKEKISVQVKIIKANIKKLKKWAEMAPDHHQHRYLLLLAEWNKYLGKDILSRNYYEEASIKARENEFAQDDALIQELAGKYYLKMNMIRLAIFYIENAVRAYAQWGASEKVRQLEEEYGQLLNLKGYDEHTISMGSSLQGSILNKDRDGLDLNTVVKASQAISGEIILGKLLEKMVSIVVQSAGAQRGVLIDNDNGQLKILVKDNLSYDSELLENSKDLPQSVIQYVARTQKSLVFGNAYKDLQFGNDAYFIREQPKSILVYPVIRKGKLSCIIFLENNLAYDAFTSARLELLDILAPQIAISIENALLYENMEDKVRIRTEEIQFKNEKLESQKDEILLQRDRLEEAQREIILKNEELRTINTSLESIVDERTADLKIALERLTESNKELDTFIYRASHDLKGPILRIQGLTMISHREPDPTRLNMNIRRIELTAIEMERVLSKLLNIHLVFMDGLENSRISFEQLCHDVTKTLQPLAWDNPEFMRLAIQPSIQLFSDNQLIKIILENLVENAIVYRKDKETLMVKVQISKKDNFVTIVVEDNGVGIDPKIEDQVFNMFYRGNEKSIGSGLGLYLVKKATEKLQGTIVLESEQYKFTRVTVKIPV